MLETDLFLLSVGTRVIVTAAFVLAMGLIIARARPSLAAVAIAMPVVIGPGFLLLALEREPHFILQAAEDGLGALAGTVAFATSIAMLAGKVQKAAILLVSLLAWLVVVAIAGRAEGLGGNLAAFSLVYLAGLWILRGAPAVPRRTVLWSDRAEIPRAMSAGLLVGFVTLGAEYMGPTIAGTLIALPVGMLFVASGVLQSDDQTRTREILSAGARGSAALALFLITLRVLVASNIAPVSAVLFATTVAVIAATALGHAVRTSPTVIER